MLNASDFLKILLFVFLFHSCTDEEYRKEISLFQFELNAEFASSETSPLTNEDRLAFHKLPFFEVNKDYRIEANLTRVENAEPFEMPTTTERKPLYKLFGIAEFELNNQLHQLEIYQNLELIKKEGYADYLFLPFGDLTNGNETYGGGRFIDLKQPTGKTIVIDFNKAYNPLCAYNHAFSCPIPPAQNRLNIPVYAGVKAPAGH